MFKPIKLDEEQFAILSSIVEEYQVIEKQHEALNGKEDMLFTRMVELTSNVISKSGDNAPQLGQFFYLKNQRSSAHRVEGFIPDWDKEFATPKVIVSHYTCPRKSLKTGEFTYPKTIDTVDIADLQRAAFGFDKKSLNYMRRFSFIIPCNWGNPLVESIPTLMHINEVDRTGPETMIQFKSVLSDGLYSMSESEFRSHISQSKTLN